MILQFKSDARGHGLRSGLCHVNSELHCQSIIGIVKPDELCRVALAANEPATSRKIKQALYQHSNGLHTKKKNA